MSNSLIAECMGIQESDLLSTAVLLLIGGQVLPERKRLVWIIVCACHIPQAELIGLMFLSARVRRRHAERAPDNVGLLQHCAVGF